ncbi:hypothetical protein WA538_001443, partial [Blastocystis sp. DL]
ETDNTVSSELLALTYGAFVSQIVKDYEEVSEINKQIEQLGYNIGIRLIEEYLAKTRTRGIRSFKHACESIATKGFSMYLGVEATLENWNEDEQSCAIRFTSNPLTRFVELPDEMSNLQYSNVYCGIIRGALEMVHMRVQCSFKQDMLKGSQENEIQVKFVEFLDDST